MKKIFAVMFLFMIALPAFALSDGAYTRMKKNDVDFARADRNLSKVWGDVKKSLSKQEFSELQQEQREWINHVRDDEADTYMEAGYTRTEAYTMATNDRANFLQALITGTPAPEQELEPQPLTAEEPEDYDDDTQPASIEGEYRNDNGFLFVKIIDADTMEVQVTFSRYKDEVSWNARGWVDDNVLELSDDKFMRCQATLTFKGKIVTVEVTNSPDWAKATAEDFIIAGTYTHI